MATFTDIVLQGTGEQVVSSQALESGKVDAAVIDMAFSKKLEQRGSMFAVTRKRPIFHLPAWISARRAGSSPTNRR